MRLVIEHSTVYRYTVPQTYTIQQLRLTPRKEPHQQVLSWQIASPGQRHALVDAFGNESHMLTLAGPHTEVRIVASGSVEVEPPPGGRLADAGPLSPLVFTVPTRFTQPDDAIIEFAWRHLPRNPGSHQLLALADALAGTVSYQPGATAVSTTAADAMRLRQGVCQDQAHLFLACCHALGIPGRYVSGYIYPGDQPHAASHAWVDVWAEEPGFAGWVSIDVTHTRFADASLCRLAIGRDYESAAPIRGVRRGGGAETMEVKVDVTH
ncbi:transglutaminase family protein [Noviherbaspirillum aridicola]|nr:transglutaminase family protein [Noviherbaspirillum aridicola]